MPSYIKAYIVVMVVGSLCYLMWRKSIRMPKSIDGRVLKIQDESRQFFIAWAALTTALFVSSNYYLFILLSIAIVIFMRKRVPEHAQGGLYIVLLLSAPVLPKNLPGFLGLNQLIEISWPMVLGLVFLLTMRRGRSITVQHRMDALMLSFFVLVAVLAFRGTTFTNGLRYAVLYFNLICVPYFVARKLCKNVATTKFVLIGFAFIVTILAGTAIFSSLRHWHVYWDVSQSLGVMGDRNYKSRSGFLRATSTLGSIQTAAIGSAVLVIYIYLMDYFKKLLSQKLVLLTIGAAIILTFSRAPWLVGAGMVVWYLLLRYKSRGLIYAAAGAGLFASLLLASGVLTSVVSGFALEDSGNVDYRQRLLELGIREVLKYPLFGNANFRNAPALQELIQGEGIIDIVNTYLQIALGFGLIATALFVVAMVVWPTLVYRRARRTGDDELLGVARVYWVVMLGMAAVIFTVSSFGFSGQFFTLLMFLVGVGHGLRKN